MGRDTGVGTQYFYFHSDSCSGIITNYYDEQIYSGLNSWMSAAIYTDYPNFTGYQVNITRSTGGTFTKYANQYCPVNPGAMQVGEYASNVDVTNTRTGGGYYQSNQWIDTVYASHFWTTDGTGAYGNGGYGYWYVAPSQQSPRYGGIWYTNCCS